MDYASFSRRLTPKVLAIVALINNPEIMPDVRQRNFEILFATVGADVYNQIYDMNAFDFEIDYTRGRGIDRRHFGLAKLTSDSVSTGSVLVQAQVANYLEQMASKAQDDAFATAKDSGKFPTVERSIVNETCKWCENLAGTYTDPEPEVFARHRSCDCKIVTSGYKSRNGLLDNYVKPKDR